MRQLRDGYLERDRNALRHHATFYRVNFSFDAALTVDVWFNEFDKVCLLLTIKVTRTIGTGRLRE